MKIKQKIVIAIAAIVLVISVVLNITLLCTDIFDGTYTKFKNGYSTKITFFDNTYSSVSQKNGQITSTDFGFYQYIPSSKYNKAEYNTLILESNKSNSSTGYKRNSVFSITYAPDGEDAVTYTCSTAIFLQVLYALLILGSMIFILIYYNRVALPGIRKKMQKDMSASLDVIQLNELKKGGE